MYYMLVYYKYTRSIKYLTHVYKTLYNEHEIIYSYQKCLKQTSLYILLGP